LGGDDKNAFFDFFPVDSFVQVDFNCVKGRLKALTIYFGSFIELVKNNTSTSAAQAFY
jgi:hypothetical protein|tara:strand:- start:2671 stop:2844 length:174 start_codon:yes stop_codon:yes gene_type:complete